MTIIGYFIITDEDFEMNEPQFGIYTDEAYFNNVEIRGGNQ